jgi:glycosyltransferase involved in cell wall biosynthesis
LVWARNVKGVLFTGFATRTTKTALIWDIGLGDNFQGLVKLLHFMALNLSDMVVTEGKAQRIQMFGNTLTKLYRKKLFHLMPGIGQDRMEVLNNLTLPSEKKTDTFKIISVASVWPRKNQKMLVAAVNELAKYHPQIQVEFVGQVLDEKYYEEIRQYIKENNLGPHVSFLGWRTDIIELMAQANVLVMSSHNEGIPVVVYEAMFSQIPVIATSVGGLPDAIVHGETGFLVEPNNTEELTKYLDLLIKNPALARQMGEKAKAFARENFSYQAYYNKYEQLFTQTIQKYAKG